jgi:Xaa-Pro dipeptidase
MADIDEQLDALYPDHVAILCGRFDAALEATGFDAVAIGAGIEINRFLDDQAYPFQANPHVLQWLPLNWHPESCLLYAAGRKPLLVIFRPNDFWRKPPALPGTPWDRHFDIVTITRPEELAEHLSKLPHRTALIGDPAQWRFEPRPGSCNPPALLDHLHYDRPNKTAYEIECIRSATALTVPAHIAAEKAFRDGSSEYETLIAFLAAGGQTERELPYPPIIAANDHGAILHYQHFDRERPDSLSLLIDAACAARGYASDVTRTHAFDSDSDFAAMITDLDAGQQAICREVRPGRPFAELHEIAHQTIAGLLNDWELVAMDPEEMVRSGTTAAFFPHGLGHYLGVQVHEVGGSLAGVDGTELPRPENHPNLRLVRSLEAGQVLTIEPGIYFIESLLTRLHNSPVKGAVNWRRIDQLRNYGGIRIEDNLVVTTTGAENLTRQAFAAAAG